MPSDRFGRDPESERDLCISGVFAEMRKHLKLAVGEQTRVTRIESLDSLPRGICEAPRTLCAARWTAATMSAAERLHAMQVVPLASNSMP